MNGGRFLFVCALVLGLTASGCVGPKSLVVADRAFDNGDLDKAEAAYLRSMRNDYLLPDEYDGVKEKLAAIATSRAEAVIASANAAGDPVSMLPDVVEARFRYASRVKNGPLLRQLDALMKRVTTKAWAKVNELQAAGRIVAAMHEGARIASFSLAVTEQQAAQLAGLKSQVAAKHRQAAQASAEHIGIQAMHEGIAHWADSTVKLTALPRLKKALQATVSRGSTSGCGDATAIASRLSGGRGDIPIQVSVRASRCKPSSRRSTRWETYYWTETQRYQTQEPVYRTVYRKTIRRTCRRGMGKYVEIYDCSQKQAVREVSGYRTVTKSRQVKRQGKRKVTSVTHSYAFQGTATLTWPGGRRVIQLRASDSRTEKATTGRNGRSISSGHTVGSIRSSVLSKALKPARSAIKTITAQAAHARWGAAHAKAVADNNQVAVIDASVYLVRLGQGSEQTVEAYFGLPNGTVLNAMSGTLGFGPPLRDLPQRKTERLPPRKRLDPADYDPNRHPLGDINCKQITLGQIKGGKDAKLTTNINRWVVIKADPAKNVIRSFRVTKTTTPSMIVP